MKILALIILGLMVVGCGKGGDITIGEPPEGEPAISADSIKDVRDSVLGEYEWEFEGSRFAESIRGDTLKLVFLENSIVELYYNGEKDTEHKWEISNGEIHIDRAEFPTGVYRINQDKSITYILSIVDGKRTDTPKERQITYKNIK